MRPGVRSILDALGDTPAFVLGRRTDILATNRMARALLADFDAKPARERNAARWMVLDETARSLFGDGWEKAASSFVGALRMDAARHPDDPRTAELVGELSIKSEDFRRWWGAQRVTVHSHDNKTLHHALVGEITLHTEVVLFPADPDQRMLMYLARPGSTSEDALKMLANWPDGGAAAPDGAAG